MMTLYCIFAIRLSFFEETYFPILSRLGFCLMVCVSPCVCVCVPVCIVHAIYRAPQVLAKILSNLEAWIQIRYKSVLTQSRLQEGPLGVFFQNIVGSYFGQLLCAYVCVSLCVCMYSCMFDVLFF